MKHKMTNSERTKMAYDLGIDDVFNTAVNKQIAKVQELFDWMDKHGGKLPSAGSSNKNIKHLGMFLSHIRCAYNGSSHKIYNETIKYINQSKYHNVLYNLTERQMHTTIKLCDWIKLNGRLPNSRCIDITERKLGYFLSRIRILYKGIYKGILKGKLYSQSITYIKNHNMLYILDQINQLDKQLTTVGVLCKWIKEHNGKVPTISTNAVLARFLCVLRRFHRGYYTKTTIYPESIKRINKEGLLHILNYSRIDHQLSQIINICNWIKLHNGKLPSRNIKLPDNSNIGEILYKLREAYNSNNGRNIYPQTIKYLKNTKMMYILDKQK